MSYSLRHLSWVFSIALHLAVLIGGAYVSTGPNIKLNLNKRMYEVNLVGPPHKGKPGASEVLTRVVLEGSNPYSSHWKGKVSGLSMPPNAVAITEGNARQLVNWILAL